MKYPWLDRYLLQKPGVERQWKAEWGWQRYLIGGKQFAAICMDADGKPYYITLKLLPVEGETLRAQYKDIIPGYYMNKQHWNSIRADGAVPDEVVRSMADRAYQLVFAGLPKKQRQKIEEETA